MNRAAVVGRGWRAFADLKRSATRSGSARPALKALGESSRSDPTAWLRVTAERHAHYRATHDVPDGQVAIVCVSSRPRFLAAVAENVRRQVGIAPGRLDVVYVANHTDVDVDAISRAFDGVESFRTAVTPADSSLGSALNRGLALTNARYIAKFDDDDLYGPHYLADSLRAHSYCGAGVVGKHTYYAHFPGDGETFLRFPGREFTYSATLAGGTLVIDRKRVGSLQFDDISLGEDRAFLAACHRRGISTFAADRFNFTQVRSSHNTWQPGSAFLVGAVPVDVNADVHHVNR